jgi:ribonuclease BN (tRNA processing enzyme)
VARQFSEGALPAVDVVAPSGFREFFLRLANSQDGARAMQEVLSIREVEPGRPFDIGPFEASTQLLPHWVRDMGTRISANGTTLVYTGDTGPSADLLELARDADTLVTEASWQTRPEGADPFHLTAAEAGEHAERSGAGRLVLSHIWPGDDRERSRQLAAEAYRGDLVVAEEGLRIEVGS